MNGFFLNSFVRPRAGFVYVERLLVICFLFFTPCLYAESEFALRLAPVVEVPVRLPQFRSGIGASAALDWAFWPFAAKFDLGVCAGGVFLNMPVKTGDPISFFEAKAGPFIRFRPFDRWGFRAGVSAGVFQFTRGEANGFKSLVTSALGLDFHLSPYFSLFAEGGYTYRIFSEGLPFSSFGAAVGLRFSLSEIVSGRTRVHVEKSGQYRVFPVSWAWYEHNPVAAVKITNEEPNAITDVSFSLFMDSYMGRPYNFAVLSRLTSGGSAEVPVTALFNEVMLGLTENVSANGVIQIQYRSLGARKETSFPLQMPIFHRNTLSWDDDRRAAAFVSSRDSAARLFARYVASIVDLHLESGQASPGILNVPKNVRYAAAMFEALGLYGISYLVVPSMSFVNLHADESALDNLTYPYETLYYRGGDCTYISILFCSLLEVLGIETAFITIPGHLYMAFDVGDRDWMVQKQEIVEIEGRRWLPLEITVPEEGFIRAWRIGAREWQISGDDAALYPIHECWKVYPSVTVTASVDYPPEMPPGFDIVEAMEAELAK